MEKEEYGMSREGVANKLNVFSTNRGRLVYIRRINKKRGLLKPKTWENILEEGITYLGPSYFEKDFLEEIYRDKFNRPHLEKAIRNATEEIESIGVLNGLAGFCLREKISSRYSEELYKKLIKTAIGIKDWHPLKSIKPSGPNDDPYDWTKIDVDPLAFYLNSITDTGFKEEAITNIVERMIKHNQEERGETSGLYGRVNNPTPEYLAGWGGNNEGLAERFIRKTCARKGLLKKVYHAKTISFAKGNERFHKGCSLDVAKKFGGRKIYEELTEIFLEQLSDQYSEETVELAEEAGRISKNDSLEERTRDAIRKALENEFETDLRQDYLFCALETAKKLGNKNLEERTRQRAGEIIESEEFTIERRIPYRNSLGESVIDYLKEIGDKPLLETALRKAYYLAKNKGNYQEALRYAWDMEHRLGIKELTSPVEKILGQERNAEMLRFAKLGGVHGREIDFERLDETATPEDWAEITVAYFKKYGNCGSRRDYEFIASLAKKAGENFDSHPLAIELYECAGSRRDLERIQSKTAQSENNF